MRRYIAFIIGAVVLVGAALWRPVAGPLLVRFPTDINRTTHYAGTFVLSVDQKTGAPLATPLTLPLTIDRHVQGIPSQSGAHTALVSETVTAHLGPETSVQRNVYAIDRRSMRNVNDPKAYTINPSTVLSRAGTIRLSFPMGVPSSGASYREWKPEVGTSYPLTSTTGPSSVSGTDVVWLSGSLAPTPIIAAEMTELKGLGLPTQLGSVPLEYRYYAHGTTAVEPRSGVIVNVKDAVAGIQVQVLGRTVPVFEMRYSQTSESVASEAAFARSQASKVAMVNRNIPIGLGAVGVLIVLLNGAWVLRQRAPAGRRVRRPRPQTA